MQLFASGPRLTELTVTVPQVQTFSRTNLVVIIIIPVRVRTAIPEIKAFRRRHRRIPKDCVNHPRLHRYSDSISESGDPGPLSPEQGQPSAISWRNEYTRGVSVIPSAHPRHSYLELCALAIAASVSILLPLITATDETLPSLRMPSFNTTSPVTLAVAAKGGYFGSEKLTISTSSFVGSPCASLLAGVTGVRVMVTLGIGLCATA